MTSQSTCSHKCKCGRDLKAYWDFAKKEWGYPEVCFECEKESKEREFIKQLEKENQERKRQKIQEILDQSNLGRRFRKRGFEQFQVDETNKNAYNLALDFKNKFPSTESIIYMGNYGTGKTHLAAAILKDVLKKGHSGVFLTMPDLINKIKSSWNEDGDDKIIKSLKEVDLLVIDDIGAENSKDWIREKLYIILNSRYESMKSTIFTTNCSWSELKKNIGERIESRLCEMCKVVRLTGPDRRKG